MVRGEGMPQYRNPFEKGRLIIQVRTLPTFTPLPGFTIKTDSNLCFQFNVVFPPSLEPSVAEKLASILPPA